MSTIYHAVSQLPSHYAHLYLSPHLDDAALSCGGLIAAQQLAGQPVLIVTFCTAAPPVSGPFSTLAQAFHAAWGLPPEAVVAARLREDAAALAILGADGLWVGGLDAIYRHPHAYTDRASLFGSPASDDPFGPQLEALIATLRARMPAARVYAPLGIGNHVDHQLVHHAALASANGHPITLYEDLPYATRPQALEARLASLPPGLCPHIAVIEATLGAKVRAVNAYTSQLSELATSQLGQPVTDPIAASQIMGTALQHYAMSVGNGLAAERLWGEHTPAA